VAEVLVKPGEVVDTNQTLVVVESAEAAGA
jgi:hypothetical protein